jgi:hypothetical protein
MSTPPPESPPAVKPGTPLFVALDRTAWARRTLLDLTRDGPGHDIERLERHFALSLRTFRDIDAELRRAAADIGAPAARWLAAYDEVSATDPLLRYVLNARDLDPEDADRPTLLTWAPDIQSFELRVVDARRASRFFDEGALVRHLFRCETDQQLFQKVADGVMPSLRRLHKAGAEMLSRYETLHLRPYERGDGSRIAPPPSHAGEPIAPHAAAALDAVIGWFELEGERLAVLAPPGPAQSLPSQ